MRLKTLEIQGFKSFPDRTKLDFNDGITCVIGPNGSGKSNIADAIRWVLGEQSTRTLRGSKMEDVIFGGTQIRKSQGVCAVTLTIDNVTRTLPFDMDTVSINRRLYRSGESEYRINGTGVRLKDVYELFMDTGLGRDGYSIIGQGRISEIISAKSKERREIFEEAAGISKFRYRKTEAERRLTLAEDNIIRIKDITMELVARLEPLKKEAEKATKFLLLSDEKKKLEVSFWVQQLRLAKDRLHKLEDDLLYKKQLFTASKDQVTVQETRIGQSYAAMQQILIEIDQMQTQMETWRQALSGAESKKAVLENDIGHNARSIKELTDLLLQNTSSESQITDVRENLQKKLQHKTDQNTVLVEKVQHGSDTIKEKLAAKATLETDMLVYHQNQSEIEIAVQSAKLDMASSQALLVENQRRTEGLLEEIAAAKELLVGIAQELLDVDALYTDIKGNILNSKDQIADMQQKKDGKSKQLLELNAQKSGFLNESKQKFGHAKLLSDMDKNMEGFGASVKYIVSQGKAGKLLGVVQPVSALISVEKQYATAIEVALGGSMQSIVVENDEIAKAAIRLLIDSKSGRATFLPLTSVKGSNLNLDNVQDMQGFVGLASTRIAFDEKYAGVMANLLGRTVLAENLDYAVQIAKKSGYRFRIVTLDGQIVNTSGAMTGGYIAKSARILGRQGEIVSLRQQAEKFMQQAGAVDLEIQAVQGKILQIEKEMMDIQIQQRMYLDDNIRCEAEQTRLHMAHRQGIAVQDNAKAQYLAICKKIADSQNYGVQHKDFLEMQERRISDIKTALANCMDQKNSIDAVLEQAHSALHQTQTEQLLCQKDLEQLVAQIQEMNKQSDNNTKYLQELKEKIATLVEQNAQATQNIASIDQNKQTISEQSKQANEKISLLTEKRNTTEQGVTILRAGQKELENTRDTFYRDLVKQEEAKGAAQAECTVFVSNLWEEYELTLSQAQEMAQAIVNVSEANRRIVEIKSQIRALGSVHVGAIEEFKEIYQRHEFLNSQLMDVEKSKTELQKLITSLTHQMCEIFVTQFHAINKNFAEIFAELFGGGKAALSLADETDILNSGIEIAVQPPGKIIKNLSALSGGEQAFVAIAIFFAILRVNPSPFCLMDEIEAALDDVNVSKFAAYLRSLADKTQFIAITHRRGTMEEADMLYGVTMQEDGVSKLLELRVDEIAAKYGVK